VRAQTGSFGDPGKIEQRADRISDPVERLRFLRSQVQKPAEPPVAVVTLRPAARAHRRIPRGVRQIAWLALVVVIALAPGPNPKGAAETSARERGLLVPRAETPESPGSVEWVVPRVWRVDRSENTEVYSNGLRVDTSFVVSNRPRAEYPVYALVGASTPAKTGTTPVGIVYHTTESHMAPFEEGENRHLRQFGRNVLEVIRQGRSYHYVIDRFGRVFSVVNESDAANHAGASVWAGAEGIYVNLNDSFIGVAFEGTTDATDEVTPAQILAAKVLTEMLRSRYGIPAENCVTHAQVSVNPLNMRVGNHTDWARNFPFGAVGLPNNYAIPLASIYAFGFEYDEVYLRAVGDNVKGLILSQKQLERQAAAEHTPYLQYRSMLRHRYKDIAAALKEQSEGGS